MNASTLLENLNAEQRAAVECVKGPVLVVAGAGSGKTRVLTTRIAYQIEKGVAPERILALTFTKKAASEMKERIALMVGDRKARRIWMGTFHSVFIRFLREYADRLGYKPDFTIYDQGDQVSAVKTCIKELGLSDSNYKPKDVLARISKAKNNLFTAAAYANSPNILTEDRIARRPDVYKVFQRYEALCKASGVMDFDDILLNMNILLKRFPDACDAISARFDAILVDEYQDTNYAQYLILKRLAAGHRNICVVGDDSQSIYAFRGARIANILNFAKDYPDYRKFELRSNYRSTKVIVEASNSLIGKNSERIPKQDCISMGEEGEPIRLVRAYTEAEEASLLTEEILSRMRSDYARYQDFAILYRTNAQSRSIEEALRRRNLPYKVWSGNSFFDRAEVKDMMAYLKLAVNPDDEESFKRVVNMPARGIGKTSLEALVAASRRTGDPLLRAAFREDLDQDGLKPAAITKIREFCAMILKANEIVGTEDAYIVANNLARQSGLLLLYKNDNTVEAQARAANIEELLNSVAVFREQRQAEFKLDKMAEEGLEDMSQIPDEAVPRVTVADFLESTALLSNADIDDEDADNKIALMTVHTAKGLEFPYVLVAGMEENLFPSGGSFITEAELEEERRLFYVAVTRAKKALALSFAVSRMRNGKHENNAPSRFLKDIKPQYLENPRLLGYGSEDSGSADPAPFGGTFRFGSVSRKGSATHYSWKESSSRSGSSVSSGSSTSTSRPVPSGFSGRPSGASPAAGQPRVVNALTGNLPPKKENFIPTPMGQINVGDRIEHDRFGLGEVLEITGTIPDLKARIAFDNYGTKLLLLKYAKIRVI